jgi:hypothetical protein
VNATIDRSKPSAAAYIWHSNNDIFVQLPDSTHVAKFPKTEAGLSRALKLLPVIPYLVDCKPQPVTRFSDELRQDARDAIRRNIK